MNCSYFPIGYLTPHPESSTIFQHLCLPIRGLWILPRVIIASNYLYLYVLFPVFHGSLVPLFCFVLWRRKDSSSLGGKGQSLEYYLGVSWMHYPSRCLRKWMQGSRAILHLRMDVTWWTNLLLNRYPRNSWNNPLEHCFQWIILFLDGPAA